MSSRENRELHAHGAEELCEAGMSLYTRALARAACAELMARLLPKLAAPLGIESRAQLGYLIGRSGILDGER